MTADDIIRLLNLEPHPEGGYFRETFRDHAEPGERPASTAIYYLLKRGQRSHWHRVDAAEVWHWYAGGALELSVSDGNKIETHRLGPALDKGEHPQIVVPKNLWQSAHPLGAYTLVGCTVAPAFTFEGFELAPPGWRPGRASA
jgi:predicted cupin superfamily sugar epimerase